MKRFLTIVTLIALIGLAAFYYFQKSGGILEIEFIKLERIKFSKVKVIPKLTLISSANAVLKNPNRFGVEITGVDFDVYVEDKHTTTIRKDISIVMPANGEFNFPVDFEIPLGKFGFFNDARDILTGAWKNQSLKIRTTGIIYIKALKFDFEIPFDEEEEYLLKDYLPE